MNSKPNDAPQLDLDRAKSMIGKIVLIGLTYYDHQGKFVEQKQMHGRIKSIIPDRGIEVILEGSREGETFWLPPDLSTCREAKPGEYREHSTGEIIHNPDY